jgi:processing peptidase subunit beta
MMDKILSRDGPGNKFYDLAYQPFWPPTEEAPELPSGSVLSQTANSAQMTVLSNGVRVVTQNNNVPSQMHMNILLNVGSRDETPENSGSMHSIKLTKYKSALVTNETVNYGMVQMSGGSYNMNFDREMASFSASCLDHDVVDIFSMMADCALEPKTLLAANVAMAKLGHSHKYMRASNNHNDLDDMVMSNVYGYSGLGNKLLGEESNIGNLNAFTLQKFQLDNFATDKMVVSAFGVQNHEEFVELVNMKMGELQHYSSGTGGRPVSEFRENKQVVNQNSNTLSTVVCFEGVSWDSPDLLSLQLMDTVLGGVEVNNFSPILAPEGQLYNDFYLKESGVNGVEAFSQHFTDSGIFGLRMNAQAQVAPDALSRLLQTVKSTFTNLTEEQFNSAKNRLRMRVLRALDNPPTRTEEMSRNVMTLDKVAFSDLLTGLNNLTRKDFVLSAKKVLSGKMNVTALGGNADNLPDLSALKKLVN